VLERPREGHGHGEADGDALRHEREARPRVFGHEHAQAVPRPRVQLRARLLDEIAREIDDEIRRIVEGAHQSAKDILGQHRASLETISEILIKRETIEREAVRGAAPGPERGRGLGAEATPPPEVPLPPGTPERAGRDTPRPLPRPGLAGGTTDARKLDFPEKPELA